MINLSSVSYSYSSAHPVLVDVDLDLGPGWHGIVGPNGAGKTTLLELVSGDRRPDTGTVRLATAGPVALCRQSVEQPGPEVRAFAASWAPEDHVLRGRLHLDPAEPERWSTLSPGERKRWQIGAALAARPDVLLLDEPTNHVDDEGRRLLVEALRGFSGVGLVVSHHRELLDTLSSSTVWVEHGAVEHRPGPYATAVEARRTERATLVERRETLARQRRRVVRRAATARAELARSEARRSREMRLAGGRDHDTTSAANTGRAAGGAAAASRRITVLGAEAERLGTAAAGIEVERRHDGPIRIEGGRAPRSVLLRWEGRLEAGGSVLVPHVEAAVGREDRIHLTGRNGAGKSTLLDLLASRWDLEPGRLLHLPQEYTAGEASRLFGEILGRPAAELGRVMQLVARLGSDPDALLVSERPSPGEMRKLAIADALGRGAWCLLLDEPTNHLDLPTIERLEAALLGYPGAIVVVSHDVRFGSAVADRRWLLEEGRLTVRGPAIA
jgi:ATPase subunit of ABC transporter with duplicated ATPase domains